jgi:hypothetical protein
MSNGKCRCGGRIKITPYPLDSGNCAVTEAIFICNECGLMYDDSEGNYPKMETKNGVLVHSKKEKK